MKKVVISVLLAVVTLSGTDAFAQFKEVVKSSKNLANLQKVIERATAPAIGRPIVKGLPVGIVPGNAIGLRRIEKPREITPVTHSYIQYLRTKGANLPDLIPHNWMGSKGERVLYEDQGRLARDLDAFYKGEADIYLGPDGREVKLYMLPADGILYIEEDYEFPLVLKADEYFVAYDVAAKTGKILPNTAQVYNLYERYKPTALHQELEDFYRSVKKAVATREGLTRSLDLKIENKMKRFPEEPTSLSMSQASNGFAFSGSDAGLYFLTVPFTPWDDSIYRLEKTLAREDRITDYWKGVWKEKKLPYVFTSESELGRALSKIHGRFGAVVQNKVTEEIFRVYELPISGLMCGFHHEGAALVRDLDMGQYVVLYKDPITSVLMDRETLEHSGNFKFYKYYYMY